MGRLKRFILTPLIVVGSALAAVVLLAPAASAATTSGVVVKAGDTLSAIGIQVDRPWLELAAFNHLQDPNLILVGEVINIPPAGWHYAYVAPAPTHPVAATPVAPETHSQAATYSASSSFEQCVIHAESRGNPQVYSPSGKYWGLYQFSYSTWVANGGAPGDYGHASAAEQHAVFARSAPSNWAPYDGC